MAAVTVTIKVETDDTIPVPIDGVAVSIYTDPGDSFVSAGVTGTPTPTSGEAEITLTGDGPGIPYFVRLFLPGVSFPAGSVFSILVTDPPSPPNFFTFTAHVGATAVVVKFSVKDSQTIPVAVEGVKVSIFDAADSFLTELVTDVNGEAEVPLVGTPDPGLDYITRLFKPGNVILDGPTKMTPVLDPVTPPASNIFDFTAFIPPTPVSNDPDMCLMSGYLVDASLAPVRGQNVRFIPREGYFHDAVSGLPFTSEPTIVRDQGIIRDVIVQTDKNGYVQVALPRGGVFDVDIHGLEIPGGQVISPILVPDVAGIDILDVFWPYIDTVVYTPTDLTMAVGDTDEVVPVVTTSNLQDLELRYTSLLQFSVADPLVASWILTPAGAVLITALAAGVTTLEVVRTEGTAAPRRPTLAAIVVTPPIITVT